MGLASADGGAAVLSVTVTFTEREADLVEIALDSAARAVVGSGYLTGDVTDPLALEYLSALQRIERAR